jgi:hypothetical protein
MNPCKGCCIEPSCTKKHLKPTSCNRPVLSPKQNVSKDFANLGRKRIAFGGTDSTFRRLSRQENVLRAGMVEGWE